MTLSCIFSKAIISTVSERFVKNATRLMAKTNPRTDNLAGPVGIEPTSLRLELRVIPLYERPKMEEAVGFEPTDRITTASGFQDRCNKPALPRFRIGVTDGS
ncbi:hypothetical protein PP427_gp179 [Salmonella phage KM16]|uniref:hypothetical protein n=1 Tax=Salmonella phage KM16 TaxID=2797303 RepID=UPI0024903381|nr:hypothetical protein PP427_gp179 [Salmonella phage KM16]